MRSTDRLLVAIIAGMVLLVLLAFGVVLTRPEPRYQETTSPEGVAHDYLLAMTRREYDRAYGYLSPSIPGYPDSLDQFIQDVGRYGYFADRAESATLRVDEVRQPGAEHAVVTVSERTFEQRGLFDSVASERTFDLTLRQTEGAWKITDSDGYWVWCWSDDEGCK